METASPKAEAFAKDWDIVDSGTGFVKSENLVASDQILKIPYLC